MSTQQLEHALEEIVSLSADLRVARTCADTLADQLAAVKSIAEDRHREIGALRVRNAELQAYHRDFITTLMREKCADRPERITIERALYDGFEKDVVVALDRYDRVMSPATERSLMFRETRVYPAAAKDLQVTQP